jgi:3-methyladenine DNA glycosylase/8-oxoguanine DNA glycosylase
MLHLVGAVQTLKQPPQCVGLSSDVVVLVSAMTGGVTMKRAEALIAIGGAFAAEGDQPVDLTEFAAVEQAEKCLAISGVGPWTANFIAMRTGVARDAPAVPVDGCAHGIEQNACTC